MSHRYHVWTVIHEPERLYLCGWGRNMKGDYVPSYHSSERLCECYESKEAADKSALQHQMMYPEHEVGTKQCRGMTHEEAVNDNDVPGR